MIDVILSHRKGAAIMADTSSIDTALNDPASMTTDGQSVSAKPIADLIAGINYKAAAAAVAKRRRGVRFSQMINPGANGNCGNGSFNSPCCGG